MNIDGSSLLRKKVKPEHQKSYDNSCFYSTSTEQYIDEDLEELKNADIYSVQAELKQHGYDTDSLLDSLFIDLNPDIIRLNMIGSQDCKQQYFNYFKESFQIIQQAFLESFFVTRKSFWKRQSQFLVVGGASLLTALLVGILIVISSLGSKPSTLPTTMTVVNDDSVIPTTVEDKLLAKHDEIRPTKQISQLFSRPSYANEKDAPQTTELSKILAGISDSDKKNIYMYLIESKNTTPDTKEFLKNAINYDSFNNQSIVSIALSKKTNHGNTLCSDNGYYKHIVSEGDSLSSIAKQCGFVYSGLSEIKDIPILNINDIIDFNFDEKMNLTKATIYKDNDFYILDFHQGKFIKHDITGEEKSIIARITINDSIYSALENSNQFKDKGDLWKKVAERLRSEYIDSIVMDKIPDGFRYTISAKYRYNKDKNYYEVIHVSILATKTRG